MADKGKVHEYYTRPKEMGAWEGFKQFLWNGETSECLGRTGASWGKSEEPQVLKNRFFFGKSFMSSCYVTPTKEKKHGGICSTLDECCEGKIDWKFSLHNLNDEFELKPEFPTSLININASNAFSA